MIWGAIFYKETLNFFGAVDTIHAQYYGNVPEQGLQDDTNTTLGDVSTIAQNNESVHPNNYTLHWLEAKEVHTLN